MDKADSDLKPVLSFFFFFFFSPTIRVSERERVIKREISVKRAAISIIRTAIKQ
jgi:hypothetical protein